MEKVYCSLCRYCDDDHNSIDYYRCYHPKYLTDTFYGKAWNTPYCDRKIRTIIALILKHILRLLESKNAKFGLTI